MLINNYGLFWQRTWIFWGKGPIAGHLKGVPASNRTDEAIDFREQQGVYVLYDESFHMVYVGQAGANDDQRLLDRLRQHTRDQLADRWTKFSWFGIRPATRAKRLRSEKETAHPSIGDVLNHIEDILISAAEPPHNQQGGRFGENVVQYLQYRDIDNIGPETIDMIRELWERDLVK